MGSNSPLHLRTQRGAATAADKKSFHFHKNEIQTRRASGFANDVFTQRRWGKKKKKRQFLLNGDYQREEIKLPGVDER